jgi:hypothetical protein
MTPPAPQWLAIVLEPECPTGGSGLQTATAQVGLWAMTCGDACGVDSRAALHPTDVPCASDQAQNPHSQLGKSVALITCHLCCPGSGAVRASCGLSCKADSVTDCEKPFFTEIDH